MDNEATVRHIGSEEIADYFDGRLTEEQERTVEEHLAECDQCTELARQYHAFSAVWDQWTARAHGEAYLRELVAAAVEKAEAKTENPAWRERLTAWRERWAGTVEAAVRVVLDPAERASRIVTDGLEALARPQTSMRFAPAGASSPSVQGAEAEAPAVTTVALSPGSPEVHVAVDGERRTVEVRLEEMPPMETAARRLDDGSTLVVVHPEELPPMRRPPLVLLIPVHEGSEPRVQEPERREGVDYVIARFDDVEPGEYLAAFEPRDG